MTALFNRLRLLNSRLSICPTSCAERGQLHDVKAAIRWLRANAGGYGIDGWRIGLWGASAGGHLATLAALTPDEEFGHQASGANAGRDVPTDVQAVARDVMAHRVVLGFDAVADNIAPAQVIERILAMVPPPTPVWNAQNNQNHQPQPQSSAAPLAYPPPSGMPHQPDFG